jgi:hypothetical protein
MRVCVRDVCFLFTSQTPMYNLYSVTTILQLLKVSDGAGSFCNV